MWAVNAARKSRNRAPPQNTISLHPSMHLNSVTISINASLLMSSRVRSNPGIPMCASPGMFMGFMVTAAPFASSSWLAGCFTETPTFKLADSSVEAFTPYVQDVTS